ncbi:hypothetical protein [Micavibrio aeruginosavorus]|uniref:Uncharacterized protein n=1 Tax=Micavibrio aeruginosavorus (strain ARL-13) TaxID=856793 RepID=G2KMX1_MICAA|nr:hypothetical protein [Micavibrio aeruginosavorus]AEP08903.1 hypothetical protein MICA_566 [Micavibrio aeruginosavorus ARL-13]
MKVFLHCSNKEETNYPYNDVVIMESLPRVGEYISVQKDDDGDIDGFFEVKGVIHCVDYGDDSEWDVDVFATETDKTMADIKFGS